MEPMTMMALGTAAASMYSANKQRKSQEKMNKANMDAEAAITQFSPFTGAGISSGADMQAGPNVAGAGMQGALAGAKFGMDFDKFNQQPQRQVASLPSSTNMYAMNTAPKPQMQFGSNPTALS